MVKSYYFTKEQLKAYPPDDPARVFAEDVANQPGNHCRWVHLACRRHTEDLLAAARRPNEFPFVYDCAKADRPAKFASQFNGVEGPLAGKPLEFLAWQRFIVAQIYGWRVKSDPRRRRYRYCYVEVPRKNGKTGFIAPLGLYQLAFPPPGARCDVYCVATKEEQAKIVWDDATRLLNTAKKWAIAFRRKTKTLTHLRTDSIWRPVGSDSKTLDGLRPEMVIMDELHRWENRHLWDVFDNAFGAAFSPLILQITTSGNDTESICYAQHKRICNVLDKVAAGTYDIADKEDTDAAYYFGCVWTRDEEDRWDDPATWRKANPSLGIVKPESEILVKLSAARANDGDRRAFMRDHLNEWGVSDLKPFIDMDRWGDCHKGVPLSYNEIWERIANQACWFGLDPSSARDITALCAVADDPDDPDGVIVAWDFWVPGENLATRIAEEGLPYDLWSRDGWVRTTEGGCIDINAIKAQCLYRRDQVMLQTMGYDEGNSQGIGISLLNDHGFPCAKVGQGFWLSPALREIERLTIAGKLKHFGNPVARAHASKAQVFEGDTRIRLSKGRSKGRIDGIAALAMAITARMESKKNPATGKSPFLFL